MITGTCADLTGGISTDRMPHSHMCQVELDNCSGNGLIFTSA
jgi:hypothetical protein